MDIMPESNIFEIFLKRYFSRDIYLSRGISEEIFLKRFLSRDIKTNHLSKTTPSLAYLPR